MNLFYISLLIHFLKYSHPVETIHTTEWSMCIVALRCHEYFIRSQNNLLQNCTSFISHHSGIISYICKANRRWPYTVRSSLTGWVHTQNDPWWFYEDTTCKHNNKKESRYSAIITCQFISKQSQHTPHGSPVSARYRVFYVCSNYASCASFITAEFNANIMLYLTLL